MAATPSMVLDDLVEPEDFFALRHDEARDALAEPVVEGVLVACGFLEIVRVATLDHLAENGEHLWKIGFDGFADNHG